MGGVLGGIAKVGAKAGSLIARGAKPILTGVSAVKNNFLKPLAKAVVPALGPLGDAAFLANQVKQFVPSGDSGGGGGGDPGVDQSSYDPGGGDPGGSSGDPGGGGGDPGGNSGGNSGDPQPGGFMPTYGSRNRGRTIDRNPRGYSGSSAEPAYQGSAEPAYQGSGGGAGGGSSIHYYQGGGGGGGGGGGDVAAQSDFVGPRRHWGHGHWGHGGDHGGYHGHGSHRRW